MSQKYLGADKRHGQTDIGYLNDILLKVSQSLFGRVGIERGKYHRLIHNHCRVLSEFIFAFLGKTKGVLV